MASGPWESELRNGEARADAASTVTINAVLRAAALWKSRRRSTAYRRRVVQPYDEFWRWGADKWSWR